VAFRTSSKAIHSSGSYLDSLGGIFSASLNSKVLWQRY
jgi:hypothetical protein